MTDRKKLGMAFWASVVLVALLAYPLSFGPACWLVRRNLTSRISVARAYRPIIICTHALPAPIRRLAGWYGGPTSEPTPFAVNMVDELRSVLYADEIIEVQQQRPDDSVSH